MIDKLFGTLAAIACGLGLLMAWSQSPLVWLGFSGFVFALLGAWAVCRLVLSVRHFRPNIGFGAWLPLSCLAAVPIWGAFQLRMGWTAYRLATEVDVLRWSVFASVLFLVLRINPLAGSEYRFRSIFANYAFAVTGLSLLDYLTGNQLFGMTTGNSAGPFLNVDHFATFILLAFPVVVCEIARSPQNQALHVVSAATLVAGVVGSRSRAGMTLLVLELMVLPLLIRRTGSERRDEAVSLKPFGALAVLAMIFAIGVGIETASSRFQHISADLPVRMQLWKASLDLFQLHPWVGSGLGTWIYVYPAHALFDQGVFANAAHSDWLQWTCDGGIVVTVCMLLLFFRSLIIAWKSPWALGLVVVFLHCAGDFPMQGKFLPCMFWVVYAVACRA